MVTSRVALLQSSRRFQSDTSLLSVRESQRQYTYWPGPGWRARAWRHKRSTVKFHPEADF